MMDDPIWGPPILQCSHLIDAKHTKPNTKRREAIIMHTGGDVAKTTKIMNTYTEIQFTEDYMKWMEYNQEKNCEGFGQQLGG